MGVRDVFRSLVQSPSGSWGAEFVRANKNLSIDDEIRALASRRSTTVWRLPTVDEALGVPPIKRAVTLIASTTGMLSVQAYRNGELMDAAPLIVARPDPNATPQAFYGSTAANMAKYGEFVWWIANRDGDGRPSALVVIPLRELDVQENPRDRLRPTYRWGDKIGTRYSPANQSGDFVHVMHPLTEPLSLRGSGPLQLCRAATSISVEAQEWAANFYGDGGYPREIIKKAGSLDPTLRDPVTLLPDPDGMSEADLLRSQWVNRPNNVPRVVDDSISVDRADPNPAAAQMLEARLHQRGDAALMFDMPGHFVEYVQSGTSLTYQTLETAFTELIRVCIQPVYLEPIEQAMSDLLTRSTTAHFNVKGFLRTDIKTRFEVHGMAIDKGIYDAAYAQREEGILPGDIEYAPVPFTPPIGPLPRLSRGDLRCDGAVAKTFGGVRRIERCNALLSRTGVYVGTCRRCKKEYQAVA